MYGSGISLAEVTAKLAATITTSASLQKCARLCGLGSRCDIFHYDGASSTGCVHHVAISH